MASFNDSIIVKLFRIAIKLWFSKSSIKVHPSFSDSAIKEIQGVARVCGHYTDESISKVKRNGSNEERNMWRRLLHDRVKKSSFSVPTAVMRAVFSLLIRASVTLSIVRLFAVSTNFR